MPIIIQKNNAPCVFQQKNGRIVRLEPYPVMNRISEDDYKSLMNEYGGFIEPRILSDANPKGCFIVQETEDNAKAQEREAGNDFHEKEKTADELMAEAKEEVEAEISKEAAESKADEKIVVMSEKAEVPVEKKRRGRRGSK